MAQIKAKIKYLKLKKLSFNFLFSIKIFKKLAPPRHVIIPYTRERMPKKFVRNKIEKRSKIALETLYKRMHRHNPVFTVITYITRIISIDCFSFNVLQYSIKSDKLCHPVLRYGSGIIKQRLSFRINTNHISILPRDKCRCTTFSETNASFRHISISKNPNTSCILI